MSFSNFLSNSDWTSEITSLQVKSAPWKLRIQEQASSSTRSTTSGDQSPDSFSSDAFSDKESSVEALVLAHKAKSTPGTLSVSDSSDTNNFEIDVCPKRKKFSTVEERRLFVEDYKRKYKTELCKNWELRKTCKFGDKCCFAHGKHELKNKTVIHMKYKTKPCKQYHQTGYCPYGQRCQYLHKEAVQPNIFFTPCQAQMEAREGYTYETLQEINQLCGTETDIGIIFAKLPSRPRLGVFGRMAEP
jgi:hypothetical protein